jgi:tellurite methyltransferase
MERPSKEVVEILKYKRSGTVLDLGVGKGRNALFLAKKGFDVVGVDKSPEAIKDFLENAKKAGVCVKGVVEDITKFKFKDYDVIISTATIHFLKKSQIDRLIEKIKKHTRKDGLNVITAFTVDNPSKNFPYLFKRGELKSYYKGWKILKYREYLTPYEKHNGMRWHRHAIAAIIAQKIF